MSQEEKTFYLTDPEALGREMYNRECSIYTSVQGRQSFALQQSAISLLRIANTLDRIANILESKGDN